MQIMIVWLILLSLWICAAPLAHTDTVKVTEEVKSAQVTASQPSQNESGTFFQESLSELVKGVGIENPLVSVKKTAEDAARSVGRSLGQYLRGQYQQLKNEDILQRFDRALSENLIGIEATPDERRRLIQKIQEDYIQDAESGRLELDQQNFRDLPKIIKKEYAEIELARTRSGNVPTYDTKGVLKTLWTVNQGVLDGPAVTYYADGEIKYIDLYKNGRKINRKKFDEEGKLIFEQNYDYELPAVSAESEKKPSPQPIPEAAASAPSPSAEGTLELAFKEIQPPSGEPR